MTGGPTGPGHAQHRAGAVLAATLALMTVLVLTLTALHARATATGRWAPAATAKIRPGVQMYTKGSQCTGNFVFTDRRGRVYVGYAAHCAGVGAPTDANGCTTSSRPLGTRVRFAAGGSLVDGGNTVGHGRLVYSSWRTMRRLGVRAPNPCHYNDFALVRVGAEDVGKVNPSVPFWGGPTGLNARSSALGDEVYGYGSSVLRAGAPALAPKQGTSLGVEANGWSHPVYVLTPGVPGDSGSGFLDARGRALGTLSTLAIAPLPGANGVGDLRRELAFAREHSGIPGLRLVRGTRSFSPLL